MRSLKDKKMTFEDYLSQLRKVYTSVGRRLKLRSPATDAKLSKFEGLIGRKLPPNLRNIWITANGTGDDFVIFAIPDLTDRYRLLSLKEATEEWEAFAVRAPQYGDYEQGSPRGRRIRSGWFEPGWVPFAGFGGGSLVLMMDLEPTKLGLVGQIINYTHDPDEITYVAPSFEQFLADSLKAISEDPDFFLSP